MADNIIDAEERRILDDSLSGTLTLHLYTTEPSDDGTGGIEVSGGSYAAQTITLGAADTVAGVTTKKNTVEIVFPTATGSWGTVTGIGIKSGGTLRWHGPLTPLAVTAPIQVRYAIGDLSLGLG